MKYQSAKDINRVMRRIANSIGPSNIYYDGFKWFSKANYTTSSEFFGELREFLLQVIHDKSMMPYHKELGEICAMIEEALFPEKRN